MHRKQPLASANMRVMQSRAGSDAELVAAVAAPVLQPSPEEADPVRAATKATDTIRPPKLLEVGSCTRVGTQTPNKLIKTPINHRGTQRILDGQHWHHSQGLSRLRLSDLGALFPGVGVVDPFLR